MTTASRNSFSPSALSLDEAKARILQQVHPHDRLEYRPLSQTLGRILGQTVDAPIDVPQHAISAMDGYAVLAEDLRNAPRPLEVIGQAFAGHPFEGRVQAGQAVRIMTGGVMPEGADTVAIQENTERSGEQVLCRAREPLGRFVRPAGSDLTQGQCVLKRGQRLGAAEIGLLASLGLTQVAVAQAPRVALLSTGDEVVPAGNLLSKGQLYDSNRPTLSALLQQCGAQVLDLGVVPDNARALEATLRQAAASADIILSTGGVSVGEADYVHDVLDALGRIELWKIAIKPGKPLTFAQIDDSHFFGLPGNPVSAMVTFYQLVRPALYALQGHSLAPIPSLRAQCTHDLNKEVGRLEFQRAIAQQDPDGQWQVSNTGLQESHALHSMSRANCFMLLPPECAGVKAGDWVEIQLLSSYQVG